ncbi:MAG: hypothetical protein GEU80_09435 [Dehalococcoidia bacterium]|nr:hypothetical protein [Dehalococcoidia bacterium]
MSARPLQGVRILDLTQIWAGPLATRILADLGAEVIKVEPPLGRGPAVVTIRGGIYPEGGPGERPWRRQGLFNKLNRNKRSLAIDLKDDEGRGVFLQLVAECDVVIDNFSARAMPSLGLDYDQLCEVNPRIIAVSMPGFGMDGPYRDWVALGPSLEPMTGLTALMGYGPDAPRVTSMAIPDAMGGVTAAAAVLTALQRREETGEGALVDLSQHEGAVAFLGEHLIEYQLTGATPGRRGSRHPVFAPQGVYRCLGDDEWIALSVRHNDDWRALGRVAGAAWAGDARFATPEARREHHDALDALLEAWTSRCEPRPLMERLQAAGVPAGVVLSAPGLLADPHLRARGFWVELDQPDVGPRPYPGTPIHITGQPAAGDWQPAPDLGEHNAAVLGGLLGLTSEEIDGLRARGVIVDRPPG